MLWLAALACSPDDPPDVAAVVTPTDDGNDLYTYEDVGVACVQTRPAGQTEVLVDFGDCLSCSEEIALSCEVSVDADQIVVTAGGSLVVLADCPSYRSTCESVTTRCTAPTLADGTYTLFYALLEAEVTLPSPDWACTGPSAVL